MDVRTLDGQVLKVSTHTGDETAGKMSVEVVPSMPSMYKVNVEDLNQLLAYHEVFGKLQPTNASDLSNNGDQNQQHSPTVAILHNSAGMVVKSCETLPNDSNAANVMSTDLSISNNSTAGSPSPVIVPTGTHTCDICGKIFPFRYQMIVHRRYHAEKKPFTCQVRYGFCKQKRIFFSFLVFWRENSYFQDCVDEEISTS